MARRRSCATHDRGSSSATSCSRACAAPSRSFSRSSSSCARMRARSTARAGVVGIEADDLLPTLGRAHGILERPLVELGDARDELHPLVRARGVLDVLVEDEGQLARVARALEDALEASERVAIAGYGLKDLVRRPLGLRQVAEALVVDREQLAKQRDAL